MLNDVAEGVKVRCLWVVEGDEDALVGVALAAEDDAHLAIDAVDGGVELLGVACLLDDCFHGRQGGTDASDEEAEGDLECGADAREDEAVAGRCVHVSCRDVLPTGLCREHCDDDGYVLAAHVVEHGRVGGACRKNVVDVVVGLNDAGLLQATAGAVGVRLAAQYFCKLDEAGSASAILEVGAPVELSELGAILGLGCGVGRLVVGSVVCFLREKMKLRGYVSL